MMDAVREERIARATLGWLCEPGDTQLRHLLATHGPVETVDLLSREDARYTVRAEIRHLSGSRLWHAATAAVDETQRIGHVVIPQDPDWPTELRDRGGAAPVCLWATGSAMIPTPQTSVTIVGARASTSYGNHVAADLAAQLADRGWTVVSTTGLGMDGTALQAALTVTGRAVAVVAHGHDQIYPPSRRWLIERLVGDGLILSVWPPGARPTRDRMRANQALLATLTAGTVVVEASLRSEALYVVRRAVDEGRVGMVVPGPVTSVTSAGCHELLRTEPRIRPVAGVEHVIATLSDGPAVPGPNARERCG